MTARTWMRTNVAAAASTGLALRAFFVFCFPASGSGDAPFYIELAWNWLKNGVYGVYTDGRLIPVDARVPGYPAFLAAIFSIAGKSPNAVLLAQAVVDLAACFLIALIAARLAPESSRRRVAIAGLWLAALCPFTANYTAVVQTETLIIFLTSLALLLLMEALAGTSRTGANGRSIPRLAFSPWFLTGIVVGLGTLVRPETPLLLAAAGLVLLLKCHKPADWLRLARAVVLMGTGLLLPLLPWAARNWHTLHKAQFLAPRYAQLPSEVAPVGFDSWTHTWLWRFKDVYLTAWNLDVEKIPVDNVPRSAFDSSQERARIANLLNEYNGTLTLSSNEDRAFAEISRERTARFPLRTFLKIPLLRSLAMWFTPRVDLLPSSSPVWPLRSEWRDDRQDLLITLFLFFVNCFYVALALAGAWIARGRPGWALLVVFIALRTLFFAGFADAPEPRYVLECFPAVIALAAQVFGIGPQLSRTGSG
ncbi:MAG TPA: glycosyltransferase family 39 protein [Candidatus Acidoferrales bacterium]|nr:glycosyltransferase family 39 protein [Candidatus Acidoferrales bacterium]